VFGAKRLSVVRFLKQNNKTKIASGTQLYNKVFAVTGPDKNVNLRENLYRVG
jgi:hypothetical protein